MFGVSLCWLIFAVCSAEKWRFPETAASVRIDSKVSFDSAQNDQNIPSNSDYFNKNIQSDEGTIQTNGVIRNPKNMRQNTHKFLIPFIDEKPVYESDGTLDSLSVCKCSRNGQKCGQRVGDSRTCGENMQLCCYTAGQRQQSEYFSDLVDERPLLLPGRGPNGGPFPAPPDTLVSGQYRPGHALESAIIAGLGPSRAPLSGLLVGPQGPKDIFGPAPQSNPQSILVGPGGPTGIIGPTNKPEFSRNPYDNSDSDNYSTRPVLVGPDGPTGVIGPNKISNFARPGGSHGNSRPNRRPENNYNGRPVLVGPSGPTGTIGPTNSQAISDFGTNRNPYSYTDNDNYSARPVLVGSDGPTGIIGPNKVSAFAGPHAPNGNIRPIQRPNDNYNRKPVLVGPDGPTGIIGPTRRPTFNPYDSNINSYDNSNFDNYSERPVLVGPGGPTGTIGPKRPLYEDSEDERPSETAQRPVLVGPGGPTGIIGPGYNQRPILVGPGGPTGIIGPRRPVLVGPGGPTGIIGPEYGFSSRQGPRRPVLVGPGGPTGRIGPYGFY